MSDLERELLRGLGETMKLWAIMRVERGDPIAWFDRQNGAAYRAEPWPSKYDGAWRIYSERAEWYESTEWVTEKVAQAAAWWEP